MLVLYLMLFLMFHITGVVWADGGHHDHQQAPQLAGRTATSVSFEKDRVLVTFGPVDVPSGHDGEMAASFPKHVFILSAPVWR